MSKPRLLDLFCGAGGAGMGYHRAGFEVVGVDIEPQPHYPFEFHQADALTFPLDGFDAIHASPPCQGYTSLRALNLHRWGTAPEHPRLIEPVRALLRASGAPWVIENVQGAPLHVPVKLCGSSFGLGVRRHRLFESSVYDLAQHPRCRHSGHDFIGVYGDHPQQGGVGSQTDGYKRKSKARTTAEACSAMGIDWPVTWREVCEAIPPAYTEWLGTQLLAALEAAA